MEIDKESQSDARQSVRQETRTFLKRQYWAVGKWTVFLFFIFLVGLGWKEAGGFLLGVIFSGANALIGFLILGKEKNPGFSFRSSIAGGFFLGGLGLLAVSLCYFLFGGLRPLIALGAGASLFSLFLHLGKGAQMTKIRKEIDPIILSADIFETYVLTNAACVVLGGLLFLHPSFVPLLPLLFTTSALLSSMISVVFIYLRRGKTPVFCFLAGLSLFVLLSGLGFFVFIIKGSRALALSDAVSEWRLVMVPLIALLGAVFIFLTSSRFNLKDRKGKCFFFSPRTEFRLALTDLSNKILFAIFLILGGLSIILPAYFISGAYGLFIAVISAVSLSPLIAAFNFYFSTTAGAFEAAGGRKEKGKKALGQLNRFFPGGMVAVQGFAILGAGFSGLILYFAYIQQLVRFGAKVQFLLDKPPILTGLFLAPLIAYCFFYLLFRPFLFNSVEGFFSLPAVFLCIAPLLVGLILGPGALAGLLVGSLLIGVFLACFIGPSVNPMIKVLGVVSLLLAACFLVY